MWTKKGKVSLVAELGEGLDVRSGLDKSGSLSPRNKPLDDIGASGFLTGAAFE